MCLSTLAYSMATSVMCHKEHNRDCHICSCTSTVTSSITSSMPWQDKRRRASWERSLVQFQCRMFVASWTGVVRYHGPRPVNRPNNVWVCNHTSMIDYIILTSYSPFAVIMQLHAGWIAFLQTRVLSCLGCLWFNRNEVRGVIDRHSIFSFVWQGLHLTLPAAISRAVLVMLL